MNSRLLNITDSLLILICLISVSGGLVYRFYSLNRLGLTISLALAVIFFIIIQYLRLLANKKNRLRPPADLENNKFGLTNFLLLIAYFLLLVFCFYILLNSRTAGAIVSPWQTVPKYFFIAYGLASLFLIGNALLNKKLTLPLIMLHYFLSLAAALIVYQPGYGYDPFIHQATENLIAKTGAVLPKPFYYLGQYSLTVIIHKITALPIVWLDRLMVPLLAALFLPLALFKLLKSWFNHESLNLILILTLLTLTFPFLIVTTPQNLAYFLLVLAILAGLDCKNYYDFLIVLLLSLSAAIIHPLAGAPALLLVAGLAIYHGDRAKIKKYLYPLLIIIASLILPALFYLLNKRLAPAALGAGPAPNGWQPRLTWPFEENFILNFVYLYGFNLKFVLAGLALSGIFIARKYREQCKILWLYFTLAAALSVSYLITAKLPFAFLINYERDDYPRRILLAASLFLLPFFILAIYGWLKKIAEKNIFIISAFSVFLAILMSAALYLSYPRHDNYFNSRGYSVSSSDLAAVSWINNDAKKDFIVLANQQVSAAALDRFGFKKYYGQGKNQIFYYPIPTGSPLYQYYLDLVYKKPSRETILKAMDLTEVNLAYFVLNKYWRAFAKIEAEAKLSANSWREIDNGEAVVFKYER